MSTQSEEPKKRKDVTGVAVHRFFNIDCAIPLAAPLGGAAHE